MHGNAARQRRIIVTLIITTGTATYAQLGVVQISVDVAVKAVFV